MVAIVTMVNIVLLLFPISLVVCVVSTSQVVLLPYYYLMYYIERYGFGGTSIGIINVSNFVKINSLAQQKHVDQHDHPCLHSFDAYCAKAA
jgi:hypothetical protein